MYKFRKSILAKFMTIFAVFILIPVVLAGRILSKRFISIFMENNIRKNLQITEQIANNINTSTKLFIHTAASIINDDDIIPTINNIDRTKDIHQRYEYVQQVESKLQYYFNYTNDLVGIVFVFKHDGYYYYKNSPRITDDEIKNMPWYRAIKDSRNEIHVLGTVENFLFSVSKENYVISLAAIPKTKGNNNIEMVYFAFKPNTFEKSILNLNFPEWARLT